MKNTVIVGCGDMGVQVYNILKHDAELNIVGFVDDNASMDSSDFLGFPVLGPSTRLKSLIQEYHLVAGITAIGSNKIRAQKNHLLKEHGLEILTAIHPQSFIDNAESIGEGTVVEMGAFIHPEAKIGCGTFVCCGAIVAHNSTVGDYVILAGGCVFGSQVEIGDYTLVGVGANIGPHLKIGRDVIVGTGAAVTKDVPDAVIIAGVPAKVLRENK